ncbi:Hypothetical predicted protein [Lecanosticta acicola]|uniref:feruloyl esterase n=1 Tax=Lecanosticta acicola TaxID=111012 RepID=A0AAI8Z6L1_9PEZI|nr:Hypothetical predicted protein [Lecanosticta acicola]
MFNNIILAATAAGWYSVAAWPLQARSSDGCGIQHQTGFNNSTSNHQVVSGGRTRTYAVNVPLDYNQDTTKRRAVIFDYHGNSRTPYEQYQDSLYYEYSAGEEYLVIYPAGVNKSWEGPTYAAKGVDDLQFTTDLLAQVRESYCVDDNQVYASGKSNGGGFVDLLACSDNGDEFSAFAMASAALYTDTSRNSCNKTRAILESHGDADQTIPYVPLKNGSGGPLPDVGQWVSWWGDRTCPGASPVESGDLGGYNTTTYSCGSYNEVIGHYQIFNLGHCWPSSTGDNFDSSKSDCQDRSLDYTPVVLDFFSRWNLSNAPN